MFGGFAGAIVWFLVSLIDLVSLVRFVSLVRLLSLVCLRYLVNSVHVVSLDSLCLLGLLDMCC